jgi:hypothetical protein
MVKNCKICDTPFELSKSPGGNNKVTCSPKCSKENSRLLKAESFKRIGPKNYRNLKEHSELWQIPVYRIMEFGLDFLKENPNFIEIIRLETKLGGHFQFLTEEEKLIRRRATQKASRLTMREKKGYNYKSCKICDNKFIPNVDRPANAVTCSDECSKELHRIQSNEASARQRLKKKLKK